jgi:hypothetical protein
MRKLLPLLALAVLVVSAAGCGGSGSSGGGGGGGGGGGNVKAADASKVANCVNNQDWIASPAGNTVSGNAASGAGFDMTIYPTAAAARAAYAKKPKKSTALVETSVISFLGTVTATGPAPPAPVDKADLAVLRTCIQQSR